MGSRARERWRGAACRPGSRCSAPCRGAAGSAPETFADAHQRLARTADFWHGWISRGNFPDHPWRKYLQRSALTLKGLIYAPTGALLAAATSSLPETPGGDRNYDYRYTWLRDSTFMLWGLYTLGFDREANDFFYFLTDLAEQEADLQIMYGIGGERELTEQTLDHLSGYDGARPVRIGNGAWDQRQHDVWGVLLDSVYLHTRSRDRLDERRWPMVKRQVEAAIAHWREPDQGLWEVRGPAQHFTASKVLCWVAADRGAKLAELRGDAESAAEWRKAADEIHADVCANGTDDRGVFCQHYGTTALDASLLLILLVGFLPPETRGCAQQCWPSPTSSPRTSWCCVTASRKPTTASAARRARLRSARSGWSRRWRRSGNCRARALCEKLLSYASPLFLYAEEIDPHSGTSPGELPASLLASGADQCRDAPDPRGRAGQRRRHHTAGLDLHAGHRRAGREVEQAMTPLTPACWWSAAGLRESPRPCRRSELGARVTLLEAAQVGGTSLNSGPAPVRTLARAARLARDWSSWAAFGLTGAPPVPDLPAVLANSQRVARYAHEKKDLAGHYPPARHRPGRGPRPRQLHRAAHDGR